MTDVRTEPQWYSQPYPPEGASAAEGIRNQLGRPELDLLTILVREAAQNSWDAKDVRQDGPVRFGIDLGYVGPAYADSWRRLMLNGAPSNEHLALRRALRAGIRIMTISDRGTNGLGGPTRAHEISEGRQDFVAFVRNVGEPRDTKLGGGTYGFGKAIFYLLSSLGTVLVHTRCRNDRGELETRLIGCALGNSYRDRDEQGEERRYTGRHWWGDASGDVIDPLIGPAAEDTARHLGLTPFREEETGTSVVILDPQLDGLEPKEAAAYLAETVAWHLWPKMLERADGTLPMRFSVTCEGRDFPIPDPRTTSPLNLFVDAFRQLGTDEGRTLSCQRPVRELGRLGLVQRPVLPLDPSPAARRAMEMVQVERSVHHVALMRPAELVVTYWPGRETGTELLSYAGVFRANEEMDTTFAEAEPPTHDAWNHQRLEGQDRTFVRTTFTRLKEAVDELLQLGGSAREGSANVALGAASARFSPLVGGAWGTGGATDYGVTSTGRATAAPDDDEEIPSARDRAGKRRKGRNVGTAESSTPEGGGARALRPRVKYAGETTYEERFGHAVLVQAFTLPVPVVQRVQVELAVALPGTGNRETDPPAGAAMPGLVGWEDPTGRLHASPTYVIEGGDETVWRAVVRPAPDTITEITVKTRAVNAS
ncbi:hypothetical protein GCM10010277_15460 [Streptomyces longisporoflavus]|uniref:hypothetical protein n=1 Tax=Streptomyces longisporoflavus TaxID=28044 RepID=UPI00167C865C|nr:hypothetical protein [Streptomyces longisporoflavus]GGV31635.1 hypothetical protein GCM10010277_15460 [Streptomyces longisporoflavus]